jgi:hypothetical protein
MFSVFLDDAPVTQYSPAVFDAFVNQTKVGPPVDLPHLATECASVLGSAPFGS